MTQTIDKARKELWDAVLSAMGKSVTVTWRSEGDKIDETLDDPYYTDFKHDNVGFALCFGPGSDRDDCARVLEAAMKFNDALRV